MQQQLAIFNSFLHWWRDELVGLMPPSLRHASHSDGERLHLVLTEAEIARVVARLKKMKVQAVAVCLLHAYVNDVHERVLKSAIQAALPDLRISLASETAREIREFERMSTTAANAYVQPVAAAYLQDLQDRLHRQDLSGPLRIMVSSGGFTSSDFAEDAGGRTGLEQTYGHLGSEV